MKTTRTEAKQVLKEKFGVEVNQENPFKKLHYSTEHLPYFHEFKNLSGLYGRHYIPILKARYYQLLGGIIQRKINIGKMFTDTRLHVAYPIVTEGGKNELIYLIKELVNLGIDKGNGERFTISQPTSFHPEQLIGKYIEVAEEIKNEKTGRMKKIKRRVENKGHFNNDFLEFDECTLLITSKAKEDQQARENLSIAENSIGRNQVEKRLTDDTPENTVKYCPQCTNSYYFQPFKKIPEEAFLQGFLRRKIIPIGNITHFLNFANDEIYNDKLNDTDFSRNNYVERVIEFLESVKQFSNQGLDIIFDSEAKELLQEYALYLSAQGQIHSEKISNFCKISKYTSLAYLVKMSVIISFVYHKQVIDKNAVCLAYMDLVELMQNTFDFIYEKTYGDFSYGTSWGGADYKQKECLKYLYSHKALSKEESGITIADFLEIVGEVYDLKEGQTRTKYLDMKKIGLIDSKQIGQTDTRVWLKFNPKIHKLNLEGDKGFKGFDTYNYVFQHQNTILEAIKPLKPPQPLRA